MRKIIATLAAVIAVAAVSAAPASAAKYQHVSDVDAANGANYYARHMDGFDESFVVTNECLHLRKALALCTVDTWTWVPEADGGSHYIHEGHALVGVMQRGGHFVFRTYKLVEQGDATDA